MFQYKIDNIRAKREGEKRKKKRRNNSAQSYLKFEMRAATKILETALGFS